jgi:hypothetical protein
MERYDRCEMRWIEPVDDERTTEARVGGVREIIETRQAGYIRRTWACEVR